MKSWWKLAVIGLAACSLAACGGANNNGGSNVRELDNMLGNGTGNGYMNQNGIMNREGDDIRYNTAIPSAYPKNGGSTNAYMNRNQRDFLSGGLNENERPAASEVLAEQIARMDEVEWAAVFLTDDSAYVGIVLEDNGNAGVDTGTEAGNAAESSRLPREVKEQIAERVTSLYPEINNVFVSANPGFLDSMNDVMNGMEQGRPIRNLIEELNEMAERIVPVSQDDRSGYGRNDMGNARGTYNGSHSPYTRPAR